MAWKAPRSLLGDWRALLLGLVNMSSHPEAPWPTYYRILALSLQV